MGTFDILDRGFALGAFLIALIISFFAWPELTVILIILGYYFSFAIVASIIGESSGCHHQALKVYGLILIIIITIFAVIYWRYGLIHNGQHVDISFLTSIYFSITTWTTLGYGDFSPVERIRHITSVQAILGYVSLGVLITLASGYLNNLATNRIELRKYTAKVKEERGSSETDS